MVFFLVFFISLQKDCDGTPRSFNSLIIRLYDSKKGPSYVFLFLWRIRNVGTHKKRSYGLSSDGAMSTLRTTVLSCDLYFETLTGIHDENFGLLPGILPVSTCQHRGTQFLKEKHAYNCNNPTSSNAHYPPKSSAL